jgi:hypothetical protein
MKFMVSRTSNWDLEEQPCEEAVKETYTSTDTRIVDDPSKLNYGSDEWYTKGTNHRVENGMIKRDFPDFEAWFIEIDSLDELLQFFRKYERLVIQEHYGSDFIKIEIYDDYRE